MDLPGTSHTGILLNQVTVVVSVTACCNGQHLAGGRLIIAHEIQSLCAK